MQDHSQRAVGRTTILIEEGELQAHPLRSFSIEKGILHCVGGSDAGLQILLKNELLLIGRDHLCDICLEKDDKVSRYHCEIQLRQDGVFVRDLESRNGTFIDYARISEAFLTPHNQLRVGDSVFVIEADSDERQAITVRYFDKSSMLVGKNQQMRKIFSMLERLGRSDVSVLLYGETGTGKSSIALALHEQSNRAGKPFVTVNCGALSPQLVESALFGYEKGAFTGADKRHAGFFEQADGGTLFLDEIGELPIDLQPKLLDVLERKCIRRLGGESEIKVDFRLVTATHMEMTGAITEKRFREDLYYRMAVVELVVPPLRERLEDLSLLINHMLEKIDDGRPEPPELTLGALQKMTRYLWPGNVRELRNVLERSLLFLEGSQMEADDILLPENKQFVVTSPTSMPTPMTVSNTEISAVPSKGDSSNLAFIGEFSNRSLDEQLQHVERQILLQTLHSFDWDIVKVFESLDISRSGLYRRMQRLGIKRR